LGADAAKVANNANLELSIGIVMRGDSRPKDGVLSHAYDPRIHPKTHRARRRL
jgi:hypothetical protein